MYQLLVRAFEQSGLIGVGTLVMREREHLVALRVLDNVIAVEVLHFADEIGDPGEIRPEGAKVGKQELDMALQLVEQFTTSFDPERYHDRYREALLKVIEEKRAGKKGRAAPPVEEAVEVPDLMAALRHSLEQARHRRGQPASGRRQERARSERRRSSRSGSSRR